MQKFQHLTYTPSYPLNIYTTLDILVTQVQMAIGLLQQSQYRHLATYRLFRGQCSFLLNGIGCSYTAMKCPENETGCTFFLGLKFFPFHTAWTFYVITIPNVLQVLYYDHYTVTLHRQGVLYLQRIRLGKNCTCGKLYPSSRPIFVENISITSHNMGIIPLTFYCATDISGKQYPASPHPKVYKVQWSSTT
jgi:hypothetical protein